MGIGSRLLHLLRANVGHYARRAPGAARPPPSAGPARPADEAPPRAEAPGWEPARPADPRRDAWARHYAALELPYGAGPRRIRSAHRRLLRRFHPDRFARRPEHVADATRLAQELTRARDTLLGAIERGELVPHPD